MRSKRSTAIAAAGPSCSPRRAKHFCAGANFGDGSTSGPGGAAARAKQAQPVAHLYMEAVRLFRTRKPIVAAVHGAAVGGGLGLAMVADFRVTCPEARLCANFTRLGFHPGLRADRHAAGGDRQRPMPALMLYTSRRFTGEEAYRMGLGRPLVAQDELRQAALKLAAEIAENSTLGVMATRSTLRADLAERVARATEHELREQTRLRTTQDFKEGVRAMAERRLPNFAGA